jgi:hypothetical protein
MIENIKLMTRSKAVDYEYFGSPTQTDWLSTYKKCLFNDSSAFALSLFGVVSERKWKVFLGRIPSGNRDSHSRQISYVVKAEGTCGNDDSMQIAKLLSFILINDNNMQKTGEKFSSEFSFDYINSLDDKRHTPETESEINAKLENIFNSIDVNVTDFDFKPDGLTFDYFSADNAKKVCTLISKITNVQLSADEKLFFAVTDLPVDSNDIDTLFSTSQEANGMVLTTDKKESINLPVVKKKSASRKNINTIESPMKSKDGWTKIQKILTYLLIISLITNCVLIFSRPSPNAEKTLLLTAERDSLNLLKSMLTDCSVSLATVNRNLDSIRALQCYNDTVNKATIKFDLAEFSKTGLCKTVMFGKDTFSVFSRINIAVKKGEVGVYKNGEAKFHTEFGL